MSQSNNFSSALLEIIARRYNLVTQEEFSAQSRLLEQSLVRISELEQQIQQMEKNALKPTP